MHLKKSEAQIGVESFGFSADFSPSRRLQVHIPIPQPDNGFTLHPSPDAVVHGLPTPSTPHKRPVVNHPSSTLKAAAHCRQFAYVRPTTPSLCRDLLRLPFSPTSRSALRHLFCRLHFHLRTLLVLSFPFLYLLLVTFSSPPFPTSPTSGRSFLLDFLSAAALSLVVLFVLSLSLNLFSFSSIRLLFSRSSSLLPLYYHLTPRPVIWYIGSPPDKPKSESHAASGLSVHVYSNGDVFEGEFHKGKFSGSGVFYYYYMSGRYEGDWVDNKYDGYGVETWARGSRYRGQYSQGMRHGFGVYQFHNGDVYAGEWWKGQSHGNGLHKCKDGSSYLGEFKCGVKHGLGLYHFRNGDTYAGEYFADKMHGFGVYLFANGHQYEGAWHEGRRQGFGIYTFRNGETQAGHWQNGILDNTLSGSPVAALQAKVLNAVQEARGLAERAFAQPKVDDRANIIVAAANKAAIAARVVAVKAVQQQTPTSTGGDLPLPFV